MRLDHSQRDGRGVPRRRAGQAPASRDRLAVSLEGEPLTPLIAWVRAGDAPSAGPPTSYSVTVHIAHSCAHEEETARRSVLSEIGEFPDENRAWFARVVSREPAIVPAAAILPKGGWVMVGRLSASASPRSWSARPVR